jgi:hypothetical protein
LTCPSPDLKIITVMNTITAQIDLEELNKLADEMWGGEGEVALNEAFIALYGQTWDGQTDRFDEIVETFRELAYTHVSINADNESIYLVGSVEE